MLCVPIYVLRSNISHSYLLLDISRQVLSWRMINRRSYNDFLIIRQRRFENFFSTSNNLTDNNYHNAKKKKIKKKTRTHPIVILI